MSALVMTEEQFYTVKEVATLLKVQPRTVRKMIADGQIDAFLVRDTYRITHSALDELIRRRPSRRDKT